MRQISWSPNGNLLASASFDATIGMWEYVGNEFSFIASFEVSFEHISSETTFHLNASSRDEFASTNCRLQLVPFLIVALVQGTCSVVTIYIIAVIVLIRDSTPYCDRDMKMR